MAAAARSSTLGPREPGVLGREKLLVAQHRRRSPSARGVALADDDEVLDRRELAAHGASNGISVSSTITTRSSAWLTTYVSCSGKSRMLSVCSTAPIDGTAR